MTKEEFMKLGEWDLTNAIFRPDQNEGNKEGLPYWPVPRKAHDSGPEVSFKEAFYNCWRARGMPDEEIDERFKNWFSDYVGPELK